MGALQKNMSMERRRREKVLEKRRRGELDHGFEESDGDWRDEGGVLLRLAEMEYARDGRWERGGGVR